MLEACDLRDFSIANWYNNFKSVVLKTQIIEIPPELLRLLQTDDLNDNEIETVCTPEYINRIKDALRTFRNEAFVKNNWHAPTDAKFMSLGNLLKVNSIDDIILYFKASDIVTNDFDNERFENYYFAIREWVNIHPASEFRCIVVSDVLRGITPRDWPTFYEHFNEEGPNIIRLISEFFQENLKDKFCRKNYIFDVVISHPELVQLVDFGPLNSKTTLHAFLWSEIEKIIKANSSEMVAPVFRFLEGDRGIMLRPKVK